MAVLCAGGLAVAIPPEAPAQNATGAPMGISVQASEQLFDTLCALDAAGFKADESTLGDMPARLALRVDLLRLQGPATNAIRSYYSGHPLADQDELLSRYITYGLVIGPPPDFSFQLDEDQLPPEVLSMQDFQPLLAAFYDEAHLGARWKTVEPEYQPLENNYRSIVRGVVVKTNSYLRETIGAQNGRSFTVYVEPLSGNATNFRNFGDEYAVVVGARPSDSATLIQHAYLHFMLDPLVLKDRNDLQSKSELLNIAARAPQLPEEFKTDFVSYVDECVVKAVELRLRELPVAEQENVLRQDDQTGFIMVRPIVDGLEKFEKDNPSMTYYLPDLIAGVDVASEERRLREVRFTMAETATAPATEKPAETTASDKEALLAMGDREIALRDGKSATDTFKKVLATSPNDSHALYGLAVASVLSGHAEESKALFEQVVANAAAAGSNSQSAGAADPSSLAWSHIYLGRIDDLEGSRPLAVREYKAALAVDGAPESARAAAQQGVDQAYAPPGRGSASSGSSQQQ
jgi:hypothetical protein